jgi:hypothetical protein
MYKAAIENLYISLNGLNTKETFMNNKLIINISMGNGTHHIKGWHMGY